MSALGITITALLADGGIAGIVGTNVYPVEAPQAVTPPFIVVNLVGEDTDKMLKGKSGYYDSRVSIECTAADATTANTLGEAVKTALEDIEKQTIAGKSDVDFSKDVSDYSDTNDDRTFKRRILDFRVRWR